MLRDEITNLDRELLKRQNSSAAASAIDTPTTTNGPGKVKSFRIKISWKEGGKLSKRTLCIGVGFLKWKC